MKTTFIEIRKYSRPNDNRMFRKNSDDEAVVLITPQGKHTVSLIMDRWCSNFDVSAKACTVAYEKWRTMIDTVKREKRWPRRASLSTGVGGGKSHTFFHLDIFADQLDKWKQFLTELFSREDSWEDIRTDHWVKEQCTVA